MNLQAFDASSLENLQSKTQRVPKIRISINGFGVFRGITLTVTLHMHASSRSGHLSAAGRAVSAGKSIPYFDVVYPLIQWAQSRRRKLALA